MIKGLHISLKWILSHSQTDMYPKLNLPNQIDTKIYHISKYLLVLLYYHISLTRPLSIEIDYQTRASSSSFFIHFLFISLNILEIVALISIPNYKKLTHSRHNFPQHNTPNTDDSKHTHIFCSPTMYHDTIST